MNNSNILLILFLLFSLPLLANDYYVHAAIGSDKNNGLSPRYPFKTLAALKNISFKAGDTIFLSSNTIHQGNIEIKNFSGTSKEPLVITSYSWLGNEGLPANAIIDFKGLANGILIENSSNVKVHNITVTGDGHEGASNRNEMTCGVLVLSSQSQNMQDILLSELKIQNVFNKNINFKRGKEEVRTANGTQAYGWGIRVINGENSAIKNIRIENNLIENVSHTGIKLSGNNKTLTQVEILNNEVRYTGGPGIQMSRVDQVEVRGNTVQHSGSNNDSRKWGRGSGLWTWGSSNVLIEKNKFLFANGPADSAGAHIDFNCENVIIQYNLSAYNAGGFCEILGNNYNCIYRYNLSINDGQRIKGQEGAFQEGKIFWLSGYQGKDQKRKGPVNTYFYNNTIYTDGSYTPKIAIEQSSKGILIANNIFALKGNTKLVMGDQYNPEKKSDEIAKNIIFTNNLYLNDESWPNNIYPKDQNPIFENPEFKNEGSLMIEGYIPQNKYHIKKGIEIYPLPGDNFRTLQELNLPKDLLDKKIQESKFIGAINP
ncbi:right-handed parallel beta-helix repeat-containing protein [Christiangramia crocea]|uniref:Right-handed parallel beta-helix repeat-containing protein n=1 Tax=Christiangramia crocea TaxID=2904124 RepID=A0A9X2A717_9FLAO|nr:right-handed parallel beta-helix repeat-containing protein [Gramella crocea]MCG9972570.1 right-handed parallel beta-helix repeat-containing protein [Gramella crocea]